MPSSTLVEVEVENGVKVEVEATFTGGWVVGWLGGVEKLRLELTSTKFS